MKCTTDMKNNWQTGLVTAVTDPKELINLLNLDENLLPAAKKAADLFPLKVPRNFINRMEKGNPNDPLLLQVLPLNAELQDVSGYVTDPLGEEAANPIPGLLHKYSSRVLFIFTGTCGVNCRYCFRRHFEYSDNNPGRPGWDKALEYIQKDTGINEVILSGGDPLIAPDVTLNRITQSLNALPAIKRLRFHSRMPIVLPERITPEFIDAVTAPNLKTIMVVHCNHPREINAEVKDAALRMQEAGITLLNQSVLLAGVNDNEAALVELSEALFDIGIQPYYLHLLDKVKGAAHFDTEIEKAKQLHWEMAKRLPGYLVPKLVYESAGAPAKLSAFG